MLQQIRRPFIRILAALFGLIVAAAPVSAAMPRFGRPFFHPFPNSANFHLTFQPLGGGARVATFNNGTMTSRLMFQPLGGGARVTTFTNSGMTARLTTQPLGGGAGVITFMNGNTQARLTFQPLGGGAAVTSFNSTGNITANQLLHLAERFNGSFVPSTAAFNGAANSYAAMATAGYGSAGYGGYGGYGGGGYGGGGGGDSTSAPTTYTTPPAASTSQNSIFDALGLPTNGGQLAWPIGLRILPPDPQTQGLRRDIETGLTSAVQQAASGQDTAQSVKRTHEDIRRLRQVLNEKGFKLSDGMVGEAKRFLTRLERAADNAGTLAAAANTSGY